MKKIILTLLLLQVVFIANAQLKVGGNPTTINSNSVLELESSNKGLLLPRVALEATNSPSPLSSFVAGMIVYNTATSGDVLPGFYVASSTRWSKIDDPNNTYTGSTSVTLNGTSFERAALTGDVTAAANSNATIISNSAVTYAKMQNVSANNRILGRATTGAGTVEEITLGSGLTLSGTTLSASSDLRLVNTSSHITQDAGVGSNGTSAGATESIMIGQGTGNSNSGGRNIFIGQEAGYANTTPTELVFIGYKAGRANTTGTKNVFIGSTNGYQITTGSNNTAVGHNNLLSSTTGSLNSAFGSGALAYNTSSNNTAIGASAMVFNTGTGNTALGALAMVNGNSGGSFNTALGSEAGYSLTGTSNTLVGFRAGSNLTSGNRNILIGETIQPQSNTGSNQLSIGNLIFGTGVDGSGTTLSSGNIGIGVAAPSEKLDVAGNVKFSGALMPNNTAGTAGQVLTSAGAGAVPTWTSLPTATNLYNADGTLTSSRTVTMGNNGLYFQGAGELYKYTGSSSVAPSLNLGRTGGEAHFAVAASNGHGLTGSVPGDAVLSTSGNLVMGPAILDKSIKLITANNERVTVLPSGNVGISTTTPTERLHVTGNIRFSGALMPNNTAGTAGQVLTSAGAGAVPTWTTLPTATTYTGSTSVTLNGTSFERAALTGDVTATANSNATTIATGAVTSAKILDGTIATADVANSAITGAKLENNIVLPGTESMTLPSGTTAQRPTTAVAGMSRYNTTDNIMEYYNGTAWIRPTAGTTYTGSTSTVLNGTSFERAALTGDVTAAQNSNALTIANDAVTSAKILDGTVATADLANSAVTYAKIQNVSANNRILGRATTGAGTVEEITLGTGLSLSGTTLNAASATTLYNGDGSLSGNRTVTQGANTLSFTSTATNGFSVDGGTFSVDAANNRVGIGTSFPSDRLHVSGGAILISDATNSGGWIKGYDDHHSIYFRETGLLNVINYYEFGGSLASGQGHIFKTGGIKTSQTTRLQIANDGIYIADNLGIGTNAPTQKLDVVGAVKFSGALMPNNTAGTAGQVLTSAGAGAVPTWTTLPTATTYTGSTSVTLNGTSFERAALTGDVTATANSNTTTIANDAVTYAKMQNVSTNNTLLGRASTGAGDVEEITLGTGLSLTGTTLNATTANTLYSADGTLSGNRIVTQGTNSLEFTSTATTGTSHFTVDGTTLNVDAVNNRIGVGTATPTFPLHVASSGASAGRFEMNSTNSAVGGVSTIELINTNNLIGNYTSIAGKASSGGFSASMEFVNTNGSHLSPIGDIRFVTNNNGTITEKLRILGSGGIRASSLAGTGSRMVVADASGNLSTQTIPTSTTYTGSTSVALNGTSFERAALTGDVTAAQNSNALTIANDAVTSAKILDGTVATADVANSAVTYAKIQNVSANNRILGRATTGAGTVEEITLGSGLTLTGTTLSASGDLRLVNTTSHITQDAGVGSNGTSAGAGEVIAIGTGAGNANSAVGSVFIGHQAGNSNTNGSGNSFVGYQSGRLHTTGPMNTYFGYQAGENSTNGNDNTYMGYRAGRNSGNGVFWNTYVGSKAGEANTSGVANAAFGAEALKSNNGNGNAAFGAGALSANTSGGENAVFGRGALPNNTTGSTNAVLGSVALYWSSTGSNNVAVGGGSGYQTTTGSNNTFIGYNSGSNNTSGSGNIVIGNSAMAPSVTASNQLSIGNLIYGTDVDGSGTTISSGNIGIGVAAPSQKLEVAGAIRFSGALMPNNTAGTAGQVLTSAGAGNVPTWTTISAGTTYTGSTSVTLNGTSFERAALTGDVTAAANSNALTIANDAVTTAKILDGTVATADVANSAVTYAKIQNVSANNRILGRATTGAGTVEEITLGTGLSLSGTTLNATPATTLYNGDGSIPASTTRSVTLGSASNLNIDANTLYVNGDNNSIGVRTSNPNSALSVNGRGQFGDNTLSLNDSNDDIYIEKNGNYTQLHMFNSDLTNPDVNAYISQNRTGSNSHGVGGSTTPGFNIWTASAHPIRFSTNASERLIISSAGNIGVGTMSPTERLDVAGNVRFSGALMPNNTAGTAGQVLTSAGAGAVPTWTTLPTATTYTGSTSVTLNGTSFERAALTGDVTAAANSNALTIANDAVTTAKIADGAITATKLSQMSATTAQVLKWNGTAWAPAADDNTIADGSETKLTAGSGITITGTGTTASPYVINANSSVATVTADYTATSSNNTILCNVPGAGMTLTLPSASANTGKVIVIRKIDNDRDVLTFSPALNYSTSQTISTLNFVKTITVQSNGTAWWVISE